MAWIWLLLAGIGEIGLVLFMKLSDGFKKIKYTVLTIVSSILSFYFLSKALITIPLGIGYAVWTGIGSAGSVIIGMVFFKESKDLKRIFYLLLIFVSVIGLRITS